MNFLAQEGITSPSLTYLYLPDASHHALETEMNKTHPSGYSDSTGGLDLVLSAQRRDKATSGEKIRAGFLEEVVVYMSEPYPLWYVWTDS